MKTLRYLLLLTIAILAAQASASRYEYRTVEGDPLQTKIYTLPNGLQVFMTENHEKPRIQTYIAVRVGGKNDPAETTGLAHYFEHLMFKGTKQFGTSDYAAEEPLLNQIEQLFEVYRVTTDSVARREIYRQIDSISYQASLIAIPNEYDKLMAAIGADGTNAYTSYDVTCYVEDIPSNQIENWARIQADRFENPVIRGFHTELETIYEEKNMSLTNDGRKLMEGMLTALFPHHPYGTQTILGTQDNLKNPSITNVRKYHAQWYVPNNMAICLSGDFDPDYMVDMITKYFGHLQPNNNLQRLQVVPEDPITEPISVDVIGLESEQVRVCWRIPAPTHPDFATIQVIDYLLSNYGSCGLIDVNLNNNQRVLGAGSGVFDLADQGCFLMLGYPNPGQSLDEVRALLLEQMDLVRRGEFDESLLASIITNQRLSFQRSLEDNDSRANYFVDAFVNGEDWADAVQGFTAFERVTKADIVRVANELFTDQNYVVLYKRQGVDDSIQKMPKPELTPVALNRDKQSAFLAEIQNTTVQPIEPEFVDLQKDVTVLRAKADSPVYYSVNTLNDYSSVIYEIDYGYGYNKQLYYADDLLDFAFTPTMTADEIKRAFYDLGCSWSYTNGLERSYFVVSGLSENLPKAVALFEDFIANATVDDETYAMFVDQTEQSRIDTKANQRSNFSALYRYMTYGDAYVNGTVIPIDELRALSPKAQLDAMRSLFTMKQTALYYGNQSPDEVVNMLNTIHFKADTYADCPTQSAFQYRSTDEPVVFVAPYDANQIYMRLWANLGGKFDSSKCAINALYDEYFGGGMNSICFQEMRESRSLAYTAWAVEFAPDLLREPYMYMAYIATQNDKMRDAVEAFHEIIFQMPQSQAAFDIAKESLIQRTRSERIVRDDIAWTGFNSSLLNLPQEQRQIVYEGIQNMTLADVVAYQQQLTGRLHFNYCILGRIEDLDMDYLSTLGRVVILTPEQIFGY